jgi:predicted dienelactone hydrolase
LKSAIFVSLFVVCATPSFAEQSLGVTSFSVAGEGDVRPLSLSLWYPGTGGTPEDVGANAVFTGVVAGRDAIVPQDRLPVVFVSHGGLRSAGDSGAWLTSGLARAGYLAIEINAPRPADAAAAVNEIWQRPDDINRAVDAILSDPEWSERIDKDRLSVVGFALGGTAALELAGGILDPQSFVQSCDAPAQGPDCAWFQSQNVALAAVDQIELAKPRRDTRIASVVAISPEYSTAFSGGLTSVAAPTLLVDLGQDSALQSDPSALVFQTVMADSTVFDGFQTCTPAGPDILADDGGDPALCGASGQARHQIHDAILSKITRFFEGIEY